MNMKSSNVMWCMCATRYFKSGEKSWEEMSNSNYKMVTDNAKLTWLLLTILFSFSFASALSMHQRFTLVPSRVLTVFLYTSYGYSLCIFRQHQPMTRLIDTINSHSNQNDTVIENKIYTSFFQGKIYTASQTTMGPCIYLHKCVFTKTVLKFSQQ